jgi:lysozyme family protein
MPTDAFVRAVSRVLKNEGEYSNDPRDPGGETMWGITRRTASANGYNGEMRFLPKEEAIRIYREAYWEPLRCDDFPFPVAFQLFDAGVNSGTIQATKWLQRALGVDDDGVIGPITLSAAGKIQPLLFGFNFIRRRQEFQQKLPTWPAFGKGWTNRNFANLEILIGDALEA